MVFQLRYRPKSGNRRMSGSSSQEMRNKAKEEAGVAVMVSLKMCKHLTTIDPEGSRLLRVKLNFRKKIDILVPYGQQANKSPKEKDDFYRDLQKAVEDTPKSHALIIAGDMNTKAMGAKKTWKK